MKGYKVFNSDWTCKGFQYKVGETYEIDGKPTCCKKGFHFCKKLVDCFNYYFFDPNNKVAEIECLGDVDFGEDKYCTNKIKIIKELSWEEVLTLVNTGDYNTGDCNSGNYNTGNYNSGDYNTGHCNTGNNNSGNYNSGNYNTGNRNSGDYNTGDYNTGNRNSGGYNSGRCNSGYRNSGDYNTGNRNTGHNNTGDYNSGNRNIGYRNTGDYNTGDYNTGDYNTGDCNTGDYNTGHCNSGYRNSGNCNSGHCNTGNYNTGNRNTGDYNKTNYSTGCFNTQEQTILMFNKPSVWTIGDWRNSKACIILNMMPKNRLKWVTSYNMNDEEKELHPNYKTTGGYLKEIEVTTEDKQNWWNDLSESDRKEVLSLPNFDKDIFKEITGIDVEIVEEIIK